MYNFIYALPQSLTVVIIAASVLLWAFLAARQPRTWHSGNVLLFLCALFGIVFITLLCREAGGGELQLIPFHALAAAKQQPELYRELLMNVFLFVPFGLALPNVLPKRKSTAQRILLTVIAAALLSLGIEWIQYRFVLGTAETDDVICNISGALVGAIHLPFADVFSK